MTDIKFLGVAIDPNGHPAGTVWRRLSQGHITTLITPDEHLPGLLALAEQPIRQFTISATPRPVDRGGQQP